MAGLRLTQWRDGAARWVALSGDGATARRLDGVPSVLGLARRAIAQGKGIAELALASAGEEVDIRPLLDDGKALAPIDHPDPRHLLVSGTGLTHLGSASARDSMHGVAEDKVTDSMRMFRMGIEGGKPGDGAVGTQPEWFYKGDGDAIVAPGAPLVRPSHAEDGGEEPEIAGVYLIADDRAPRRIGFVLANEYSDHVMERRNYLYLAHSKLRACSIGPELLLGDLPGDVRGTSRIRRGGKAVWEKGFASGDENMCHSIANLEHHHFKYGLFRRPGDVHVHFFGTATLSFADGFRAEDGDVFEIESPLFGLPLRNPLRIDRERERPVRVAPL